MTENELKILIGNNIKKYRKEKDLSNVKYSPVVKKLYKFKGEL